MPGERFIYYQNNLLRMTRPKGTPISDRGKKISEAMKLAYANGSRTTGFKKGNVLCRNFKGKTHTDEWKKQRSDAMKTNNPMKNPEVAKKVSETRIKLEIGVGPKNPNWVGGNRCYRGPGYNRQRSIAMSRDNYQCQECGIKQNDIDRQLDVHHIIPFKDGGTNRLDNLVTVCRSCHNKIEPKEEEIIEWIY